MIFSGSRRKIKDKIKTINSYFVSLLCAIKESSNNLQRHCIARVIVFFQLQFCLFKIQKNNTIRIISTSQATKSSSTIKFKHFCVYI